MSRFQPSTKQETHLEWKNDSLSSCITKSQSQPSWRPPWGYLFHGFPDSNQDNSSQNNWRLSVVWSTTWKWLVLADISPGARTHRGTAGLGQVQGLRQCRGQAAWSQQLRLEETSSRLQTNLLIKAGSAVRSDQVAQEFSYWDLKNLWGQKL